MKLKNIVLGAALSLPLLALADNTSSNPFAGAFAGVGLGYTSTHGKLSQDGVSQDLGNGGLAGEVVAGYNYGFNSSWLIGGQAFFDANSAKVADGNGNGDSAKMPQAYGADLTVGYLLSSDAMVFAGGGYASSKLKDADIGDSVNFNGWQGLIGAQQSLANSLSLRESMVYTSYSSKTIDGVTARPSQFTGLLSLIYTFNM